MDLAKDLLHQLSTVSKILPDNTIVVKEQSRMVTGRKKEEKNMDRIFLVSLTVKVPVVAASEEDARTFLLHEEGVAEDCVRQVLSNCEEEDDIEETLEVEEVTEESLYREHSEYANLFPWGDDGEETIADRLDTGEDFDDDEDDEDLWGEPNHEED